MQKASGKFTHVWKGVFMSMETKLCHVWVVHVNDMLHWCLHALVVQKVAITDLSESSPAQLRYPQTQQNIKLH